MHPRGYAKIRQMTLPDLRPDGIANESPHVVILGAGASLAACPNGDWYGRRLPCHVESRRDGGSNS